MIWQHRCSQVTGRSRQTMRTPHFSHSERAKQALEMTMRDALDGLEELASLDVYWFESGCLEILGIEPPTRNSATVTPLHRSTHPAKILNFDQNRRKTG